MKENESYAGTDWGLCDNNCQTETFGTITKTMRDIMGDKENYNKKTRDQAEAVLNLMTYVGKAKAPVGVKGALEEVTRGGKVVDFIDNKYTERRKTAQAKKVPQEVKKDEPSE